MRPSQRLGGVVLLLLLSASGCAGVQSRTNGSARNPEEAAPSRSASWFGSRFWARPTPTSASAAAGTGVTPDADTARPTAPETDIWPGPRSSGLSRRFPMLGNRDRGKGTASDGDVYPTLASLSTPAAAPDGSNDRQVRPGSGDEVAKGASARQQAARAKAASTAQRDVPELLPSPIAVRVPVKLHDRPESRGAVALEVEPADLNEGEEATRGTSPRDLVVSSTPELPETRQPALSKPARNRPRREAYLIATAASAADLTTTGGDEPAQPSTSSPQPAPSAVSQQPKPTTPKPPTTAPSTTPSTGSPPPPLAPSTPSAGPPPPPLGPATSPSPARDSPPVPPTAPTPSLPAPVPVPVPEPVPTAEPGPKPVPSTLEPASPTAVPAPVPVPAGQGLATAPSPAPAASGQGSLGLAQASPSPQASVRSAGKPVKPPHKSCWLLAWIHSLHQPAPPPKCQLPSVMFPTTYQTCVPGPRPTGQTVAGCVQPAPQSPQASTPPPAPAPAPTPTPAPQGRRKRRAFHGFTMEWPRTFSPRYEAGDTAARATATTPGSDSGGEPASAVRASAANPLRLRLRPRPARARCCPKASPGWAHGAPYRAISRSGTRSSSASRPRASTKRLSASSNWSAISGYCSMTLFCSQRSSGLQ